MKRYPARKHAFAKRVSGVTVDTVLLAVHAYLRRFYALNGTRAPPTIMHVPKIMKSSLRRNDLIDTNGHHCSIQEAWAGLHGQVSCNDGSW